MKFTKLTKKLLLSALSLGLAVVTLTTTTFAWYTSSTEAGATSGSASTSGQTSDTSLMISSDYGTVEDKKTAHWGPTATITAGSINLVPLQWDADNKTLKPLSTGTALATDYYEFKLWFKTTGSSSAVAVYLKGLTIKNVKDDLTLFPTLVNGENTTGCPTTNYAVDVVKALDMIIASGSNKNVYDLTGNTGVTAITDKGTFNGDPDAVAYYNNVMPVDLKGTDNVSTKLDHTQVGTISKGVDQVLEVTFTIFLNGWDKYCFDACRGQSFTVALDFTTKTKGQA